ncbi:MULTISPECIES: hypothetical protein [Anaerolinea]|uniref:hypothetical protein n=1 Tax=Anaerolinea TaxID=233189 RepID=UPI00262B37B0|nr:hypothetical protein [Anaerolinea thermophila]
MMNYQPENFADRIEQIALVENMLTSFGRGGSRVILVEGERGLGKTWLALHMHRTILSQKERVKSLLILMMSPPEITTAPGEYHLPSLASQKSESREIQQQIQDLLEWMANELKVSLPPNPVLDEICDRIIQKIKSDEFTRYWLLLDSVYESPWEFVEAFETVFLMRFLALPNAFLWASGRGKPYPWKTPEATRAQICPLEPFNEDGLKEQLQKMGFTGTELEERLEWVKELGAGIPLLTHTLVQETEKNQALEKAVQVLLEFLPGEKRQEIRSYLEPLSVLDGFREEEMAYLLKGDEDSVSLPLPKVRTIRDALLQVFLIRWENSRFVLDRPLQKVLQEYLRVCKPEQWEMWNRRMIKYFEEQMSSPAFRKYENFLKKKIEYHRHLLGGNENTPIATATSVPGQGIL